MAKKQHTGLSSVACNAAEASRTLTLDRDDLNDLVNHVGIGFYLTPGAAGSTVVSVIIYKSANNGAKWHRVPAWSDPDSTGTYTGVSFTQQVTLTEEGGFWVDIDMSGANALKVIFSTDTEDASDSMDVTASSEYGRW